MEVVELSNPECAQDTKNCVEVADFQPLIIL